MSVIRTDQHKINELERKINILLARQTNTPQSKFQFTDHEVIQLKEVISLFNSLANEGATTEELLEQFQYLSDIQAFKNIKNTLAEQYNSEQYGVHANIYNFNFNSFDFVHNSITTNDKIGILEGNYFTTGFIILEGRKNAMIANQTNVLLDTFNDTTRWTLSLEEDFPKLVVVAKSADIISLIGSYDILQNNSSREIPDHTFYAIYYASRNGVTKLQFIYLFVDLIESTVSIKYHTEQIIQTEDFEYLVSRLPSRVTLVALGSETRQDNELITLENLFINQRLESFETNLYRTFQDEFTNNNVNSLYGQSAAVGISQLYSTVGSTVRQLSGEYVLKTPTKSYPGVGIPDSFDIFTVPDKNIFDIIGNSAPQVYLLYQRLEWPIEEFVFSYAPFRLKKSHYPTLNLVNEIAGKYRTGFSLAEWRQNVKKSQITQYLSDGTTNELNCWIETDTVPSNLVGNVNKGTWLKIDDDNILLAQMDGDFTDNIYNKIQCGIQVTVRDPNNLIQANVKYSLLHGYEHVHNVSQTINFIIDVNNVSQEGAVSQSITLQMSQDGEEKTITVPIIKRKILYGSGEIMAYIATIDTSNIQQRFYMGQAFQIEFFENQTVSYFNGRAANNVPNTSTSDSLNLFRPQYTGKWAEFEYMLANGALISMRSSPTTIAPEPPMSSIRRLTPAPFLQTATPTLITVPFSPPILTYTNQQQSTTWSETKTTYIALSNDAEVMVKNVGATGNCVYRVKYENLNNIDGNDVIPLRCTFQSGPVVSYDQFNTYTSPEITIPNFYTQSEIWHGTDTTSRINYVITTADFTIDDIFLPNSTLDQLSLSENIVNLQNAVQFLEYYASYLKILIDNLDERLHYVEETLDEIITILNQMVARSQTSLGFAGSLVTFLGTGIGMFFPLIGLGISLLGGVLTSVDRIEQGDVIMGSVDLVVGGIMGSLGIYKYTKRLKTKYGQTEFPNEPLVDTVNIAIFPGYTIINNDPPPMYTSGRRRNGMLRNTMMDVVSSTTETVTTNTTRLTRQSTLHDQIEWTVNPIYANPRHYSAHGVCIETIGESFARSTTITREYYYALTRLMEDGTFEERKLTQEEFEQCMDISIPIEEYVKLEMHYMTSVKPYNTNIGMDDDTFVCLVSSNGYAMHDPGLATKKKHFKHAKGSLSKRWTIKSDRVNRAEKRNLLQPTYGTVLGSQTIFDAMNPYRQLESAQVNMYQNCIEECESVFV